MFVYFEVVAVPNYRFCSDLKFTLQHSNEKLFTFYALLTMKDETVTTFSVSNSTQKEGWKYGLCLHALHLTCGTHSFQVV